MSFKELAEKRQSCRSYDYDKKPTHEQLERVIETAKLAPSACNSQPWRFYAACADTAKTVAKCTQLFGLNKWTDECPSFIVITEAKAKLLRRITENLGVGSQFYAQIDMGIIASHICYAAMDEGMSTCILGCFDETELIKALKIPEEEKLRLVIAIGYAKDERIIEKKRNETNDILKFYE